MADSKTIGILGGGVMGGGIAQVCALAGLSAIVVEVDQAAADRTRQALESGKYGLARAVERGKIQAAEAESAKKLVRYSVHKKDLSNCDLLIEAVPENRELKKKLFAEFDTLCSPKTVFASNTSGFSITDLATSVSRKDRFLGMHFFSPVPVMKVLEIIRTKETSEDSLKLAEEVSKKIGRTSIRVKDAPGSYGFVANRIYLAMLKEAQAVLAEGVASMEDIDTVMRLGYNWPVGPFGMIQGAKDGWKKPKP